MELSNLTPKQLQELAERGGPPGREVLEQKDRVTVHTSLYHEHFGSQPLHIQSSSSMLLETIEQPFTRRTKVGPKRTPLELGWMEKPGMVGIENRAGMARTRNPTEEERAADAALVVCVDLGGGQPLIVRPGRLQLFEVADPASVHLTCPTGTVEIHIHVLPR